MPEVRELTAGTVVAMLDLTVAADQSHLVAPNDVTLAQALYESGSEVFGIYEGDVPVGLMAVIDTAHPHADLDEGDPTDAIYIWRLMVDQHHQGKGNGRAALEHAIQLAQVRGRTQVLLSVVPDDQSAMPFYENAGFVRTGRIVDNEIELRRPVSSD